MCTPSTFKHKVHNWFKQGEESLERESKQSSFGKKSHSSRSSSKSGRSRSSNSSTKERAIAERIWIAGLKADASFLERKHATKYEAEALRIQEQMVKAEARAKVFEMMDQQSTKSEADLMKMKKYIIQSRATERDICDNLLDQQHQQHLNHPRTQLLNEDQRRSIDNESSYVARRGDQIFGNHRSSITSCLSTAAESAPKSSPVKIYSLKSLPREKRLAFLPLRQYCIT